MSNDAAQADGGDDPQVFVSYSRADAEPVGAITRLLEDAGVTVWRDCERILGGQYFGEAIVHAIAHSRVLLLMCSSPRERSHAKAPRRKTITQKDSRVANANHVNPSPL
jgi:hypothetical protein